MNKKAYLILDIRDDCVSCPCCTPNLPLECQAMHNRRITKNKPDWCPLIEIEMSSKTYESSETEEDNDIYWTVTDGGVHVN